MHKSFTVVRIVNQSCVLMILASFCCCFTGSGNGVIVDFFNIMSLLVLKLWLVDLLYASYDEGTYCTPVMMRGPIVRQLWWEDVLYTSYVKGSYFTPVMMRGPIVRQSWWGDLLYASYDERTYCTPVMMRGPIVRQLWWEDLLYASYDERTYCTPVMCGKKQRNKQFLTNFTGFFFHTITLLVFVTPVLLP